MSKDMCRRFERSQTMSPDIHGDNAQLISTVTLMFPDMYTKVRQRRATLPDVAGDTCRRTFVP